MYERNAIVLERYFNKLFEFNLANNLRINYTNYKKLYESYENYSSSFEEKEKISGEFNKISNELVKLQKNQERLYNKDAKIEYSRYIIFNNLNESPSTISKHLKQVETDIERNKEALKDLGERFIEAVKTYDEKKEALDKLTNETDNYKQVFDDMLKKTTKCYKAIKQEQINVGKDFINHETKNYKRELSNIMTENGQNERNPFDSDVIENAINTSITIYCVEMEVYLTAYERSAKLLTEIDIDSVKKDRHNKFFKDSKLKLDFLNAEKEYVIQFLDNERIAAIYDKKIHRKLMLEACRNLNSDFEQINKLYEIIQKEVSGRFTKKLYKENYNKKYLFNLENSENDDFDSSKIKNKSMAVMNLNYWRIEGIRRIYEVFDKDILEAYGRDVNEFIETTEINTNQDIQENDSKIENEEEVIIPITEELEEINETEDQEQDYDIKNIDLLNTEYEDEEDENQDLMFTNSILSKIDDLDIIEDEIETSKKTKTKSKTSMIKKEDKEKNPSKIIENNNSKKIKKTKKEEKNDKKDIIETKNKVLYKASKNALKDAVYIALKNENELNKNDSLFSDDLNDKMYEMLGMYFDEKENSSKKSKISKNLNNIKKAENKVNVFSKLIGINSKKKREA